jgi:hypothetical protein
VENLVFSTGYGYPVEYLQPFLKSISRNMQSADVVLFYHDTSEHAVNRLRNYLGTVKVIKPSDHLVRQAITILPKGRRTLSQLIHPLTRNLSPYSPSLTGIYSVNFARYFWAAEFCERVDITQYKKVMLCDSRDVIVQSDVFDKVDQINFVTGTEERRIGECPFNQDYVLGSYGKDILGKLWEEVIVNSGVSLGPRESVLEYLRAVTQEMKRIGKRLVGGRRGDQSIHNYLIRSNALKFPVRITKSMDGIIGTLAYYDKDRIFIDADNVCLENGITPSIIHQYDYFPKVSHHVARLYGSSASR